MLAASICRSNVYVWETCGKDRPFFIQMISKEIQQDRCVFSKMDDCFQANEG